MLKQVLAACGLSAATMAASCTVTLDVRQALRPAPPIDCLASALQSSPDVAEVRKTQFHYGYATIDFAVYDSTAKADRGLRQKAGQRVGQLARFGDSREGDRVPGDTVIVQFAWPGRTPPPDADVRALAEVAVRVLRHAQERCRPQEGTSPACALQGRPLPCPVETP